MVSTQNKNNSFITEAWIPIQCYQLTLNHRLLSQLGEISHFILQSLLQTSVTLEDFESITQLSEKQLNLVMERLKGLGLIDWQGKLTPNYGEPIAYILKNLHQNSVQFWLDQRYYFEKRAILMFKSDSTLIKPIPENAIKIEPKKLERDWSADCFYQSERLRKSIQTVLPWLFPAFENIPNIEKMKWGQEWELDLRVRDTEFSKNYGLPIELELFSQIPENSVVSVFTKVLDLETKFELAQGIDFSSSLICPPALKFQYSFAEEAIYSNLSYVDSPNSDNVLESPEDLDNKEIAISLLALCHEETEDNSHKSYSLFNRLHKFSIGWQEYGADWSQVIKCLPETEDRYKE